MAGVEAVRALLLDERACELLQLSDGGFYSVRKRGLVSHHFAGASCVPFRIQGIGGALLFWRV